MILLIYVIIIVTIWLNECLNEIFEDEKKQYNHVYGKERYNKMLDKLICICGKLRITIIALLTIYCIFMLIYSIITKNWIIGIISVLYFILVLFIILNKYSIYFIDVTEWCEKISFYLWLFVTIGISTLGIFFTPGDSTIKENIEKIETINILEFKQSEYNSITGNRYYIKSSPSNAYYYEVRTNDGGTTTKTIDGTTNYIEKYEDNKYVENPHIDVFKVERCKISTNLYGFKMNHPEPSYYKYYIYIPEDSTFYEN